MNYLLSLMYKKLLLLSSFFSILSKLRKKIIQNLGHTRVFISHFFIGWQDALRELKEQDDRKIKQLQRIREKRKERSERQQAQYAAQLEEEIFIKGYAK